MLNLELLLIKLLLIQSSDSSLFYQIMWKLQDNMSLYAKYYLVTFTLFGKINLHLKIELRVI